MGGGVAEGWVVGDRRSQSAATRRRGGGVSIVGDVDVVIIILKVGADVMVTIYRIINWCNGRCYVGQTACDIDYRFRKHCKANSVIGRAIRDYGVENFTVEVIEVCEDVIANERERFWIKHYNCFVPFGYNVSRRGHFPKPKKQQ